MFLAVTVSVAAGSTWIYQLPGVELIEEDAINAELDDKKAALVGSNMRPSIKPFATRHQ